MPANGRRDLIRRLKVNVKSEETNRSWFHRCGYSSLHRFQWKSLFTTVPCQISELIRWKPNPYTFTHGRFIRPSSKPYPPLLAAVCSSLVILCRLTRLPRFLHDVPTAHHVVLPILSYATHVAASRNPSHA